MFCRYCGNEVLEQAYMCPACKNMLKALPTEKFVTEQESDASKESAKSPKRDKFKVAGMVLSIVCIVLSAVQILFLFGAFSAFATALWGMEYTQDDWAALGWFGVVLFAYSWVISMALSPFSTATGIVGFIFGRKTEHKKVKKLSLVSFILAMIALTIAIAFVIFITYNGQMG